MRWILVTGGVCSGVGKGCVAAMLARICARSGLPVRYQKIEPCLQGEIRELPNTHFGEIVHAPTGAVFDGDVARAAFYVPGFLPVEGSDVSLGRLLEETLLRVRGSAAPRLNELDGALMDRLEVPGPSPVVEVGGTAGEPEHRVVCEALRRVLGPPALHVHVTTLVATPPPARWTTKPAQLALEALVFPADLILVRGAKEGAASLSPLGQQVGARIPVLELPEDVDWPERAAARRLASGPAMGVLQRTLGFTAAEDPLFSGGEGSREIVAIHDGAGAEGYASLMHRLRAWSGGRVRARWQTDTRLPPSACGVIRIGERPAPALASAVGLPLLEIVPVERGEPPRDALARPDWRGTADSPEGPVRDFVERLLSLPAVAERGELAYADPGFARLYLEASRGAALRDHSALDELVARALPDGERLQRARVLDVGCGDGRWAARLVEKGARAVVGVEAAPPMAAAARARNLERFTLLEASITACELEGEFDAILASMSLDHVAELGPVLRRLCAHLAPRGRLVVTTEHPLRTAPRSGARWLDEGGARAARVQDYGVEDWRTFYWFDHPAPVRVYHRTVEGWVRAIREAGLELVALHEPVTPGARDGGVPRFWMLVVEKAGPRAPLITVDGAAATGKSSFGEALALRLGWRPVDSGRLQRAFAWRHLRGSRESIRHEMRPGGGRYLVGSRDVTEELDTEEVARACAELGAAAQRELSELLERLTAQPCVVMGRAMGRLYPAPLARFFLAASLETRAARRGCRPDILEERDRRDAERGRLLLPDIDSVYLETDSLAVGELVERALGAIQGRLAEMEGRPELRGPRAS